MLDIGFIRKVDYPRLVANVIVVKKIEAAEHLIKWLMCTDYTDLNGACPNESFPLPRINRPIDATADRELLSLLDA